MALTHEQNERLRQEARRLLVDRYNENVSMLARALEISQPMTSRFLSGDAGTSLEVAQRIAELSGIDIVDLLGLRSKGTGAQAAESDSRISLGALPTWAEAEKAARKIYRYVPEEAWLGARRFSTGVPLATLTPEVVLHLALAVDAATTDKRRPPSSPDNIPARKAS